MKKTYIYIIIILTSLTSCGKKSFEFESKMNPERTYSLSMNMSSTNHVKYLSENEELKDKTSESKNSTQMTRITTTKGVDKRGQFNATIEYGKIVSIINGNKTENPISGTIVNGVYVDKNKFRVDSVISDQLNEKTKQAIKYALENVKPTIDFPIEPIKIGDSFEHKMPMTIPVNGVNPVKIEIFKIYTLKSVNNNIAIFDLQQSIHLNKEVNQTNVIAKGDGNGIVEFDILENQIINDKSNFTIKLNVIVNEELSVNTVVGSTSEITTTIE